MWPDPLGEVQREGLGSAAGTPALAIE